MSLPEKKCQGHFQIIEGKSPNGFYSRIAGYKVNAVPPGIYRTGTK